jgi:non-ribosomal peptide synthetase-like protein
LLGVRIGKRVFDDGCGIVEKTLVTIGDDCTLNAGSKIQCHSQEDGAFKSDHIVIGSGCTLGVSSMVHYGVTMGNGSALAADAFLMKGEEMPKNARWGGNPAREMREDHGRMALAAIPPQLVGHHAQSH